MNTAYYTAEEKKVVSALELLLINKENKTARKIFDRVYKGNKDKRDFLFNYFLDNLETLNKGNEEEVEDLIGTILFYSEEWDNQF